MVLQSIGCVCPAHSGELRAALRQSTFTNLLSQICKPSQFGFQTELKYHKQGVLCRPKLGGLCFAVTTLGRVHLGRFTSCGYRDFLTGLLYKRLIPTNRGAWVAMLPVWLHRNGGRLLIGGSQLTWVL
ncbi:unnamed protein product [Durusdinium trenchii]|uniref:Uncharacterized protein n=1 Tax=Durusdinium trenchii TaxID=1381693 RepID=A0ABP0RKB3_9DINO